MGCVLIIDSDEWIAQMLAETLAEAGFEAFTRHTAKEGLDAACMLMPDCIVCELELPDFNGAWVARQVRQQPTEVASTPFLFVTRSDDPDVNLQGFRVGADALMTKPFSAEEAMAQIRALLAMVERFGSRSSLAIHPDTPPPSTMQGSLGHASVQTLLSVINLERRSGDLQVNSPSGNIHVVISQGRPTQCRIGRRDTLPEEAIRRVCAAKVGTFSFQAGEKDAPPLDAESIGEILLRVQYSSKHHGSAPSIGRVPAAPRLPTFALDKTTGSLPNLPASHRAANETRNLRPTAPAPDSEGDPVSIEEVEADLSSYRPPK